MFLTNNNKPLSKRYFKQKWIMEIQKMHQEWNWRDLKCMIVVVGYFRDFFFLPNSIKKQIDNCYSLCIFHIKKYKRPQENLIDENRLIGRGSYICFRWSSITWYIHNNQGFMLAIWKFNIMRKELQILVSRLVNCNRNLKRN